MSDTWTIYTDGGSRGNPGPAAYAYVIKRQGQPDLEEKGYLGKTTNNIAEYTGLVKALEHAKELGAKKLVVNSDSELMVKQMNGQYRVKNEGLRPLYEQAVKLRKHFDTVTIKHIYRDQNSQADALCNEAMDDRSPVAHDSNRVIADKTRSESHPTKTEVAVAHDSNRVLPAEKTRLESSPSKSDASLTPLMQALDLMKQSAARWAKNGDASDPPPAEVLNRILEIIQQDEPQS